MFAFGRALVHVAFPRHARLQAATCKLPALGCPVQLVNWTNAEEAPQFVGLADHCAYRQLLHLPGNSYAGTRGRGWRPLAGPVGRWHACGGPATALVRRHGFTVLAPLAPSGRLKYLLACGSAVVMPDSSWQEFW